MINTSDRQRTITLIREATQSGARLQPACEVTGISPRTYQRWTAKETVKADARPTAQHPIPANALDHTARQSILELCNSNEFSRQSPAQIVPKLADRGIYIASESTFYRILRQADQLTHRGKNKAAKSSPKPRGYKATRPNQVWSWDITYLASDIAGKFYRLYLIIDIFSRCIVHWEVHENETADKAAALIKL